MGITPNKKNLFKFFKSKDFNEARMKMCALYIILSYANELHEDVDRLLKGYEGLFIGSLKKASKDATRALEEYDKQYMAHIVEDGSFRLCDTTIDVTSQLDETIEKNKFYLQQCYNIIANELNKQIDENVKDEDELEREAHEDFEIISTKELEEAIQHVVTQARKHKNYETVKDKNDFEEGLKVGFRTAVSWVNNLYLNCK